MRYASNISFLAQTRRFLASGLFAGVRRGACLRLRSFTARETSSGGRLQGLGGALKTIVAVIGRYTCATHAHTAATIATTAVYSISSASNRLNLRGRFRESRVISILKSS